MERNYTPRNFFNEWVDKERSNSYKYGAKTVFGDAKSLEMNPNNSISGS